MMEPIGPGRAARRNGNGRDAGPRGNGAGGSLGQAWAWLRGLVRPRGNHEESLRHTIEELIEESERADQEGATIGTHERVMLANILHLRHLTAYDVMVPRADIVAAQVDSSLDDLIEVMSRKGHSRLPIYRDNLDDIVGLVHIKDVLTHVKGKRAFRLSRITREVLFVAPSMPVLDLLLEMRLTRVHMALVVDEFGGIDGLVTIEDLVEEIVGEIEDEHDVVEEPKLIERPDGSLVADARMPIEAFEDRVGPVLTDEEREEDIDTLGGLLFVLADRVPGRGELIVHPSGISFEVMEADPRRVKRLRIRNLPPRPPDETPDD